MASYERIREEFARTNPSGKSKDRLAAAKRFVRKTHGEFHWNTESYRDLANGREYAVEEGGLTTGMYRPFFKQRLYFNRQLNSRTGEFAEIYPDPKAKNLGISITGTGVSTPSYALMTDAISDDGFAGHTVYLPRWRYVPPEEAFSTADKLERTSNINPSTLTDYREHYGDDSITDEDLFHHVYGVLHSKQYRETFAADLGKTSARIPVPDTIEDFREFVKAGRELARLHVEYESIEPYADSQ